MYQLSVTGLLTWGAIDEVQTIVEGKKRPRLHEDLMEDIPRPMKLQRILPPLFNIPLGGILINPVEGVTSSIHFILFQ